MNKTLIFIAGVFVLAGMVKGVIGLGLPTISMGLLALVVRPAEAAAILLLPSFVTNVWQMLDGRALPALMRRLWPMLLAVCLGTWAGRGWLDGTGARTGSILLGLALAAYGLIGLTAIQLRTPPRSEPWLSPAIGAITGAITAATGVFVIPAVPYLQAIGLSKDELVQALGLSFTVSTVALGINLAAAGPFDRSIWTAAAVGLVASIAGMVAGQRLRGILSPLVFRRVFFLALVALGAALVLRPPA